MTIDVANEIEQNGFKYYIFDWDDNILHMPTRIHLEHRRPDGKWAVVKVSTSIFAMVRNDTENYRPPGGEWERAFVEFRDFAHLPESQFLADTRSALAPVIEGRKTGAPSFQVFKQALIEGRLFAIVTARGHHSSTLRRGVEVFIETVLSKAERTAMLANLKGYLDYFEIYREDMTDKEIFDNYLGLGKYHAVTSPQFLTFMGEEGGGLAAGQEVAKQIAIRDFVEHVLGILKESRHDKPISIGFSDDDPHNVAAIEQYIAEQLADRYPGVKFVVYDTSDPTQPSGKKNVVRGQLDLGLGGR